MGKRILTAKQIIEKARQDISAIKQTATANIVMKGAEPDIIADYIIDMAKDKEELKGLIETALTLIGQEGEE